MIFEFIRKLTLPFDQIESYIPTKGNILDVGCGHGVFSEMIAKKSLNRKVLGIDPSSHKIELAKANYKSLKNLTFKQAYLEDISNSRFDCIIIIDVLYLLSNGDKTKILKLCKTLLKKGGILILKEIDSKPSLMFSFLQLEETIMVKLLKYTFSDQKKLYFLSRENYIANLKKIGFKIIENKSITGILPYPHMLFAAKK